MSKIKDKIWLKRFYRQIKINLTRVSPTIASKLIYRISMGSKLNLRNPKNFNEKIMWLKLNTYYKNPLITKCSDKYAVRNYIIENGCEEILNDIIDVYDSSKEIDWNVLPNKFVIKCNHGCGYNIICRDKSKVDKHESIRRLDEWMSQDYYLGNAEVNYKFIKKKIICEKYLETNDGSLPTDYKVYCFDGVPKLVLVCYERDVTLKLAFFDTEWKPIDIGYDSPTSLPVLRKPESFDKMIEYSKKLSKGFPFVRMDYYNINEKVVFGEMTFTPAGGLAKYYNQEGLNYLGDMLRLPEKK